MIQPSLCCTTANVVHAKLRWLALLRCTVIQQGQLCHGALPSDTLPSLAVRRLLVVCMILSCSSLESGSAVGGRLCHVFCTLSRILSKVGHRLSTGPWSYTTCSTPSTNGTRRQSKPSSRCSVPVKIRLSGKTTRAGIGNWEMQVLWGLSMQHAAMLPDGTARILARHTSSISCERSTHSAGNTVGTCSTSFTASLPGKDAFETSVVGDFMTSRLLPSVTMLFSFVAKLMVSRCTCKAAREVRDHCKLCCSTRGVLCGRA